MAGATNDPGLSYIGVAFFLKVELSVVSIFLVRVEFKSFIGVPIDLSFGLTPRAVYAPSRVTPLRVLPVFLEFEVALTFSLELDVSLLSPGVFGSS